MLDVAEVEATLVEDVEVAEVEAKDVDAEAVVVDVEDVEAKEVDANEVVVEDVLVMVVVPNDGVATSLILSNDVHDKDCVCSIFKYWNYKGLDFS